MIKVVVGKDKIEERNELMHGKLHKLDMYRMIHMTVRKPGSVAD